MAKRERGRTQSPPNGSEFNELGHEEFGPRPPEFTAALPDVSYFRETSVGLRENPPMAEDGAADEAAERRGEKRKKREAYLRGFLRSSMRGGAAVLALALGVAAIAVNGDPERLGPFAERIREVVGELRRPAVITPKDGPGAEALLALWQGEAEAPHQYDPASYVVIREPNCLEEGLAEETCSVCGTVRQTVLPAGGHVPGEAVTENPVYADCRLPGTADTVVRCELCGAELSRGKITVPALGSHTPGEPVIGNTVPATCAEEGSHEETVCCAVCGAELSRETVADPRLPHTPAEEAVTENRRNPSCTAAGSYDEVIYCTVCGGEVSRETHTVAALGHDFPVGDYPNLPTYCRRCGAAAFTVRGDAARNSFVYSIDPGFLAQVRAAGFVPFRIFVTPYDYYPNYYGENVNYSGATGYFTPTFDIPYDVHLLFTFECYPASFTPDATAGPSEYVRVVSLPVSLDGTN